MKFKVFIVFVFFVYCLLPGISLAQNKIVVSSLWSDNGNEIQTVTSNGQVWMDRNLGAVRVAQSLDDYQAYGWLYQWGRLADGHEMRSSPTIANISGVNVPGHGNFITTSSLPYDWRRPQNNNLWQGASGVNNPCPAGFRLPTETEWDTERASWGENNFAGAFASPLKLVVAGYRSRSNGTVHSAGSRGYYWSSTVGRSDARSLHFDSGGASMGRSGRAYGFSVRCLKD